EGHPLRIESAGQPGGGDLQTRALDAQRVIALDQRVVVRQEVEGIDARIAAGEHCRADGAGVVAQVRRAGGGDAGKDTRAHDSAWLCRWAGRSSWPVAPGLRPQRRGSTSSRSSTSLP